MTDPSQDIQKKLNLAARALAKAGFVHAYGHCSTRLDADTFLVCAAKPMGLIDLAEAGTIVPIAGDLPQGVLGEVRIHQQIYKNRPDINAVCRTMPPHIMALAALARTPKPRHGFGTYFSPEIPLWNDPQLIRTMEQAIGVAGVLGDGRAVMMRGNGLVCAGADIEQAVVWTWYAEDMARIELEHLKTGLDNPVISPAACAQRAIVKGRILERMWEHLTAGIT
ncbi:MAG: class II aldolase [Robiginitomaculum sp.]|nr:MAG: class II aldolase [Robiginitomaculum sp.]